MPQDNGTVLSTQTFEITIPGQDKPIMFTGTQDAMWAHLAPHMKGVDGMPTFKVLDEPKDKPAPEEPKEEPTDTVRSTMDLLAAQAVGFAPQRPYYDRGTPVVGLGVSNARKSARDWEAMPTLNSAVDEFVSHVVSEHRREQVVPITSLAMRADGSLTGPDVPWTLEPNALSQLGARLGIENPAYLTSVWPELRARNWNQWLATAVQHEKSTCPADHPARERLVNAKDKSIKARLRDNADGTPAVWAVVGPDYPCYDVDAIATALKRGMGGYQDARCEIEYDGAKAKMDVLFHSDVKPERYVAGEFFKAGLRVRTSDAGGGSIIVSLLLWQNLCLNLICIDVAKFTIDRIPHRSSVEAMADRFRSAVSQGEAKLQHFLKQWGFACDQPLAEVTNDGFKPSALNILNEMDNSKAISETDLLTGVFRGLGKQGMSIGNNDLPGLLAAHARDNSGAKELAPVTRASIVNAVTRYAHEDVGRSNPAKQHTLESEAGALLVGSSGGNPAPLPFMAPTQRQHTART